MLLMLLGCLLLFGGIFAFKMFGKMMMNRAFDTMALPPATVTSASVEQQTWSTRLSAVGSLRAVNGVEVTTQAEGVVSNIYFKSGETVEAGALLVELTAEPERAQLKVLEAELQLARRDYDRIKKLHGRGVTTDAELDDALSTLEQVLASIEVQRATVAERRVKAPFSGQLGIRQVDLGENISPGDPVVSLQQLSPIYADFSLPEQHFAQLQVGQTISLRTGAYPERRFAGQVTAIDPRIDNESRNFLVQATLPNDGQELRPGMYADVTLELAAERSVLVVPRTAIRFAPYGNSVFVLQEATEGEGYVANRRVVQTGEERGDLVEILKGVEAGQQVATSGLLKLRNEGAVIINNENRPSSEIDPNPENR
ncbi:efflux RND transporter periplasmic adaptor subunit [Microbulbifer flavimaris]|uniref:Efflux RND transporter periplasmic adaptor subunit n=2 Tax=Microbulbiferaceae TaxID=1706373 RepID=A0ABX4HVN1_9GAMM|nr:efflux transporter periplasmic adaptor subunit [Microbulbifer sp. ZGT114]PCO04162.1 efflux RND transporter periplasmic adaptor subunit [Microbulbifer flavimaris]